MDSKRVLLLKSAWCSLQLYGTCLYMAAKFFEMWPGPPKEEIREHMKSQPSDKAMFLMEWRVLELLEGELCVSSLFDFVRRGVK